MISSSPYQELNEVMLEEAVSSDEYNEIVVLNDDFNTFEWVIECFIEILNHTAEQAEQSAWIIHTKGKCSVKVGPLEVLKPMKDALVDRGLNAIIETERVRR